MSFTERLKVIIDVTTGNATKSLSDFRTEVSKAEGFSGKLKAGTKSLGDSFMSFAATPAAAGAALSAVGTFALSAARDFSDLARESLNLGKATGLSTEQASRWIEVGKDLGVEAGTIASAIGKMNRSLSPAVAKQYGIALYDASGKARSANDIFIDVLAKLSQTKGASERAQMGTKLLGRGWQALAPVLGKSRAEYELMLQSVRDGQVVTDAEAASAEETRAKLQDLADAWDDLKGKTGAFVNDAAPPLLDTLSKIIEYAPALYNIGRGKPLISPSGEINSFAELVARTLGGSVPANAKAGRDAIIKMGGPDVAGPLGNLVGAINEVADAADVTQRGIRDIEDAFKSLINEIDQRSQLRGLMDDFDAVKQAAQDYWDAVKNGADDAAAKERDYQQALDDLRLATINYADSVGGIPPTAVTKILAEIDKGSYDVAKSLLASLADVKVTYYGRVTEKGIPVYTPPYTEGPRRALGGPVSKSSMYQVAEGGKPELLTDSAGRTFLIPGRDGVVTPISGTGTTGSAGGHTFNITITNPVMSGEQLANELRRYIQRNGNGWLQ